jgi:hypothetical protein
MWGGFTRFLKAGPAFGSVRQLRARAGRACQGSGARNEGFDPCPAVAPGERFRIVDGFSHPLFHRMEAFLTTNGGRGARGAIAAHLAGLPGSRLARAA